MGDIAKVPMPAEVQTDVCALRSSASASCVAAEESGTEAQLASTSNQQHDSPDAHQEASRAQAHGRKHARDRNANGAPTRPHTKKGQWSEEEEMTLVLHHREVGNKWAAISKYLPLRSDNDVKNHWNSTLRSKSQQKHCTFLWLYAKDVESVADSEIARQQCFEAAQRAYDQLRDNGVCAASASAGHTLSSVHTRAVRRGASSTALAPRATNAGSRTPWSSSSHGGQYRPVRQTCESYAGIVDKTDDSGSLSGDPQHLTECGGSHCTTGDLNESPFSGEGTQAFANYQYQPQHHQHHHNPYASDAGVPLSARAGWAARHNGMGEFAADGEEGVVASREDMDGEVMMASGPGQHSMVSMPGSSGSGKTGGWDMPVVGLSAYAPGSVPKQGMMTGQGQGATSSGTACAAGAWLAANQAGWLNLTCPSPGLVMLQPGVNSLEDAIAMDLEDTSFDNLAVDTFLRIRERNQAAAAAASANMQQEQSTGLGMDVSMGGSAQTTESMEVPQDGELLNNPRLSVHAPSPSPFPYSRGGHMANTMHKDAGSDHSSCLSNPMSFGGNLGGCTSATAGSGAASGFPFTNNTNHSHHHSTSATNPTSNTSNLSTQQPTGGMAGFMPVAATTTPDLLHMGFSHQHDGLGGEMEDQDTTLVMIKDEFASYGGDPLAGNGGDVADGANMLSWSNGGNGYFGSSSNMFGVLGLSPRSGSGTARAAMAGATFCMGNGGAAARSGPSRHSVDLPIHASYRSRALEAGTTGMFGASGGMMDGEAGSHLPGIGLRAEALPVDPTDPGSGDGSTQRHSSPADGQNGSAGGLSGFAGGAFEVSGIDGPNAGKPLLWGSADSTWSPAIPPGNTKNAGDGMEMQPPSRMGGSWSADGYNHGILRAGAAIGGFQSPLWTNATGGMASTGALNAFVGGGMIPEDQEGKGIGSEQWSGGMDAGGSTAYMDGVHGKGQGVGGTTSNGRKIMRANSAHLPRTTAEASAAQAAGAGNALGLAGPRVIIHKLPTTSKWNTAVAAAKGWPTGSNSRRQQH